MTLIKVILSLTLYLIGDLIGKLLRFNCFHKLYPLYNRIMVKSSDLDTEEKVWKSPKK
jgi:hypothetical protein